MYIHVHVDKLVSLIHKITKCQTLHVCNQTNVEGGEGEGGYSLQYSIPSIIHKARTDPNIRIYEITSLESVVHFSASLFLDSDFAYHTYSGVSLDSDCAYQHTGHKWDFT